jgi:hypothetical protein
MLAVHQRHRPLARVAFSLAIAGGIAIVAGLFGAPHRTVQASDPMGIYTLVEDVVIESTKPGQPERVRIYGISALAFRPPAEGGHFQGGTYSSPASGYLYFTCPEGKVEVCRMEWADLEKAIGDERCAAYGDRYLTDPKPNGRLRPPDEPPDAPDSYPIAQGVTLTRQGAQGTCAEIRELAAAGTVPTAAPEDTGSFLPNLAAEPPDANLADESPDANLADESPEDGDEDSPLAESGASDESDAAPASAPGAPDGGGTGPTSPPLTLLVLLGIGALGIASAAAWSRKRS